MCVRVCELQMPQAILHIRQATRNVNLCLALFFAIMISALKAANRSDAGGRIASF